MSARSAKRAAKQLKLRREEFDRRFSSLRGWKRPGSQNRKKGFSLKSFGSSVRRKR